MTIKIFGFIFLLYFLIGNGFTHLLPKRSIDLKAAHSLIVDSRLPREIAPNSYTLDLQPFPEEGHFKGHVKINVTWHEPADKITLHVHEDLKISHTEVKVTQFTPDDETLKSSMVPYQLTNIKVLRTEVVLKQPLYVIYLDRELKTGAQCVVEIKFVGKLYNDTSEGLFRSSYINTVTGEKKWFIASQLRPNLARKVFPCFDEPAFKATFLVSIVRSNAMRALTNMPLSKSEALSDGSNWIRDHFVESPPMSTFAFGVLVSDLVSIPIDNGGDKKDIDTVINVWARPDFLGAIQNASDKIYTSLKALEKFWDFKFPLPKLDCIALPNYQGTRPADNWGLIFFKESELSSKGSWQITHELVYQWLGALATPFWWSDAHINNALARYVSAYITLKISDEKAFHNWPMTMLYSMYYEFSKRFPHGKVMAIKQDTSSTKTELIFRMLNYTLGEKTFNRGLQRFISDRQYRTFFGDDVWSSITEQARVDGRLEESITANEIAGSWITKDRLPVINVVRSEDGTSATVTQKVYLRERPHDVPDQEKFLWWIPIVVIKQDSLNFSNSSPVMWMKRQREVTISDLPPSNKFIIVNPEEIGPFPVNYDNNNWKLLSEYLQTDERKIIPVNTRAKLLHDAWNLAYAGDLNFSIALDMTLFLKSERECLAWDPVFTMIDHIGRHIDGSNVHKKFLMYVRMLLTPLYEELGDETQDGESDGKSNLRSSSKVFLCQAGYKPCIEEAQTAFNKWMEAENPDEGNPVAYQFICPVFKWGSIEEWEFGLQRVVNFPPSRKQSERTYLLKTLAGCPIDSWKIEKILNITILEQNANFTDNDIYLIFSMLTGSSSGYTTLFNYLSKNWNALKKAFENKPQLWNNLITSSTSVFKTQEGLDKVTNLYKERQQDFGTADFVIVKSLKIIKEEAKWSNDNLPVIENWLDKYLSKQNNEKKAEEDKFL